MKTIRLGSRGSRLALAQANWVKTRLSERLPDAEVKTVVIKTSGDRLGDAPIQSLEGKGLFVKEIEEALLRNQIDLAVHSMKDLPGEMTKGLAVGAVPEREDPSDVLVSRGSARLKDLDSGVRIGTGSPRRRAQILNFRHDLSVVPIRGNIDTRLKKMETGEVEALVLAAAGLKRIGRADRIAEYLPPEICLSAVAQGALCLQTRAEDPLIEALSFIHHRPSALEVEAERAFLRELGGGCQLPVACRARIDAETIQILGVIAEVDGREVFRGEVSGRSLEREILGRDLARRLMRESGMHPAKPAV
jgi:hydroxymethylbilane synthase